MAWLVLVLLAIVFITRRFLAGEDLSRYDSNVVPRPAREPSEAHHAIVERMGEMAGVSQGSRGRARLQAMRAYLDSFGDEHEYNAEIRTAGPGEPCGEWVLAPGADPAKRLLYIHGGAWVMGSPRSHRNLTTRLSELTGAAVFSLDYRLMPENSRRRGIDDCRAAWRWLLDHGPDGLLPAQFLAVAGDSAGGNLTLSLLGWIKAEGIRAPDCAVALSPATDGTLTGPSARSNVATDAMLGPQFGKLARLPLPLLWWGSWVTNRVRPSHPDVSPIHGDLSGLPPVLVQASEAEMLLDDARRYVTKAREAGSPVELQTWPHVVHVWQMFNPELPEAEEALSEIAVFIERVAAGSMTKEGLAA